MSKVLGRAITTASGSLVFLGRKDDSHCLGFKNTEGTETRLKLSDEAFKALVMLVTDKNAGLPETEFPADDGMVWVEASQPMIAEERTP